MNTMVEAVEISVVVPVYRSEATLCELVRRIDAVLDGMEVGAEVILVNDGSPDGSWQLMQGLGRDYPRLRGLLLARNFGQHAALLAGVLASRGRYVVTLDDDLQTPPEEMPKLLAELARGHDLVYGQRIAESHGWLRDSCSVLVKLLLKKVFRVRWATSITSYRAFRGRLRDLMTQRTEPVICLDALLTWGTDRIGSAVVQHEERRVGVSGYSAGKLMRHAVMLVTSFSGMPLKLSAGLGLGAVAMGLLLGFAAVGEILLGGAEWRWFVLLLAGGAFMGGLQLMVLGFAGEYLAQMHRRLMGMPAYAVREEFRAERQGWPAERGAGGPGARNLEGVELVS